jgi:two-component system sensor histidine kinase RstB
VRRTFLRLWLACGLLFAVGMVAHEFLVFFVWSEEEAQFWEEGSAPMMRLGAEALAEADDEAAALRRLEAQMGSPVALVADPPAEVQRQLAEGEEVAWIPDEAGGVLYIPVEGKAALLAVGPMPAYPLPDPVPRLVLLLAVMGGLAVATGLLLRPLDRSQRSVAASAAKLAAGEMTARIDPADAEAAPGVAAAFNDMADRIEALADHQQHLLRSASHELRTPLARLRLGIHLLSEEEDAEARAAQVEALEGDLDELEALVDDILTHARLEREGVRSRAEPVVPGPVVEAALAGQRALAGGLHLETGAGLDAAPSVRAVPRLLRRAIDNLVGNARRYARSTVCVDAAPDGDAVWIHVDDDGPGIPEADRARALGAFATLDEKSGHGMGLAIVQRIAAAHGGRVRLATAPLGGLRVSLRWPRS